MLRLPCRSGCKVSTARKTTRKENLTRQRRLNYCQNPYGHGAYSRRQYRPSTPQLPCEIPHIPTNREHKPSIEVYSGGSRGIQELQSRKQSCQKTRAEFTGPAVNRQLKLQVTTKPTEVRVSHSAVPKTRMNGQGPRVVTITILRYI